MNALSAVSSSSPAPESEPIRLRVLSLGTGVQSTTLGLMAAHGEIGPMLDCAIFADIRDTDPEAWADTVDLDRTIRTGFRISVSTALRLSGRKRVRGVWGFS